MSGGTAGVRGGAVEHRTGQELGDSRNGRGSTDKGTGKSNGKQPREGMPNRVVHRAHTRLGSRWGVIIRQAAPSSS